MSIMKKLFITAALIVSNLIFLSSLYAAETQLLEPGVYGYTGLGAGLATRVGGERAEEYTYQSDLALKQDAHSYFSLNLGLIWKRRNIPGWQSSFQISYRPFSFSIAGSGTKHSYGQRALSFDFLENYGFFNRWTPYVGLSISSFGLSFSDSSNTAAGTTMRQVAQIGFIGGWDIIAEPNSNWRFRTTFRWHPNISLTYDGKRVQFPNFEIEPIQVIYRF